MTLAFVFPGQGSQSVGMLAELAAEQPLVKSTFDEASSVLGYDLWQLVQDGPEHRLSQTEQTQPAMLAAGVAVWRVWRARGGALPAVCAGHSLGEYSALVAGGALEFTTAVSLVAARGRFMQEAVPAGQGAIAAVLGLDDAQVCSICDQVSAAGDAQHVAAVNFNAPGQVVIAGHAGAVAEALERARAAGARKAVPLPMSVPVHCELMRPATERLLQRLRGAHIATPELAIVHNADLRSHEQADDIRAALAAQLYTPVRWTKTVQALVSHGATLVVECGPGRVLSGLIRRIDRQLRCLPIHDSASLDQALAAAREGT